MTNIYMAPANNTTTHNAQYNRSIGRRRIVDKTRTKNETNRKSHVTGHDSVPADKIYDTDNFLERHSLVVR